MKSKIEEAIERMNDDFKVFSALVLKQFSMLKKVYETQGAEREDIYKEMEMNERVIDGFEVKMREEIVRSIVLYSPRAGDLRKIMAYHDMSSYLERMGDLMKNVAEYLLQFRSDSPTLKELRVRWLDLFVVAEKMTQNAIFAFSCEDNLLARNTIAKDTVADQLQEEITRRMVEMPLSELKQEDIQGIVCLSGMAYNVERIADHATNIAEAALFLMEGREWKHKDNPE